MTNEVKTCEVVVELPTLTKGYHYTGEYRKLVAGESFVVVGSSGSSIITLRGITAHKHHVVEKDRWVPAIGDSVWYIHDSFIILTYVWQPHHTALTENINLFKTEAIAEIARSNFHALLVEADLNNM